MLRRTTLTVLALLVTAAAGLFAADRMGVDLPWNVASLSGSGPADKNETVSADSGKAEETPSDSSKTAETAIEETVAALTGDQGESAEPRPGSVALDISRVSPDGPSVFAGRAEPNAYVTVFADGKPAGTVRADEGGSWSLSTEYKFASADPAITFEAATTPPPKPEPEPEPAEPARTAAASGETAQETEQPADDAPAVAGDVMRKFENLVSEAREEAAAEEAKRKDEAKAEEEKAEVERTDVAGTGAEPAEAAREEESPERETTVAAATATQPPAASGQPQQDTAKDKDDAPTSDVKSSASADSMPGASSTVGSETEKKTAQTETAMTAAPAASAKPATPAPIPVPIMFVYNQPTLTPEGERAAELLLEYLLLKRLDAIELTGHADERGTHAYNFDLSRERLEAVAEILKDGGYKGELRLTPKGKTEPFTGIDRKKYRGEALYQFDRRVELRVAR